MVKKVMIVMVMLQATSMSQAMMTGMRKVPGMANSTMRNVGGIMPSMMYGSPGSAPAYHFTGKASAPPKYAPLDIDVDQYQAQKTVPIDVESIMQSNNQQGERKNSDGVEQDQAPKFDQGNFIHNAAVQGSVAQAIYVPIVGGMQKRSFSSNARSTYVPFKPQSNSPYDILGVSKGATVEQCQTAYRKLMQQYHPDLNQENKDAATQATQIINDAYDKITQGGQKNIQVDVDEWESQSPQPSQREVRYAYKDYIDYAARRNSYSHSDDSAYYDERSRQTKTQRQAFISDPNSAYNKPKTLNDALQYNDEMRNLKTIENFLKHLSSQEEINNALLDKLNSHNMSFGTDKNMSDSDFEILKLLINASDDMNYQHDENNGSLLIQACKISRQYIDRVMSLMIKKNINPNAIDPQNGCPLLLNLIHGHASLDILKQVITKGADVNYVIMPPAYSDYRTYTGYVHKKVLDVVQDMLTSPQNTDRNYYNSVIVLLKKNGATNTSMWEKMKRKF